MLEPVPSVLRPGSAPYGQAIRDLSARLRTTTDHAARLRLQETIFHMSDLHKEATGQADG